jgi:hypothetical protein
MTATKPVANNTETIEDQTPVVDVDVVSSDSTTKPEAPAKSEDPTTPEFSVSEEGKAILEDAKRVEDRNLKARVYTQALESSGHYQDLGCFYAASTPVPAAFGAEIGVVTKDEKTGAIQRTGVGLYIRSDHAAGCQYDLSA